MSKVPDGIQLDEVAPVARRVLLDGLIALKSHLGALTVVGAQAVYLRTAGVDIPVAAFTSDGDLGVDPALLLDEPQLENALQEAGFERLQQNQSGLWFRTEEIGGKSVPVELDLLVGATLVGGGRRSVDIPPHHKMSVRSVPGLETAVVDRSPMSISAQEDTDKRVVTVHVAGPCALLVAKAHKLHDRLAGKPERLTAKDAGDVYRLMVGTQPGDVRQRFATLLTDDRVGEVTATGLRYLREQFGGADAPGVRLAVSALGGAVSEGRIRTIAPSYIAGLPDL